jgi:hypothetical protein
MGKGDGLDIDDDGSACRHCSCQGQYRRSTVRLLGFVPRLLLIVAAGALLLTATVVGIAPRIWSTANAHEELPVVLPEFEALAQRTYVYDVNGQEIAFYELENSQPIAYEDIPPAVIDAFLVVEDKEFFNHDGINVRSLIRATLSNFASDSPQQGASTITMQVAKNDFLAGLERDGRYKLLQMHYARMLENQMSKEDIMARYLNTVFFGNNAYGIEAAAETYFGKAARDLTFIESAFLAGLVRSPSGFDPINEPERSRARWIQVLGRLADEEKITEAEFEQLSEDFVLPSRVQSLPGRSFARTYFTEALRDYLLNKTDILGETYQERYNQLFRGGLRIHTTLDANLQSLAEQARTELPDVEPFDAAIVSLDSSTGAIRAMVGGRGFVSNEREVNMALSPRQTGSSVKMFILAAAVQAGAQANDVLDGTRPCVLPNPGNEAEPFEIKDAVNRGVVTLQEHTTASINCAFGRLSQIVGLHRVVDTIYRMAPVAVPVSRPTAVRAAADRTVRQPRDRRQRDGSDRHGVGRPGAGQRGTASRSVLRRFHRQSRRGTDLHPPRPGLPGARARRRSGDGRDPEGSDLRWRYRPACGIRGSPAGLRQDRHPGGQHQRLVRRRDEAVVDGGVGRQSQRLHTDAGDPGLRGRRLRPQRAGRSFPGGDLEGLHAACACVRAVRRLGSATATEAPQRPPVPPRQRVRGPCRRERTGPGRSECATDHGAAAESRRHTGGDRTDGPDGPGDRAGARSGAGRHDDPAREPGSAGAAAVAADLGSVGILRRCHTGPQ